MTSTELKMLHLPFAILNLTSASNKTSKSQVRLPFKPSQYNALAKHGKTKSLPFLYQNEHNIPWYPRYLYRYYNFILAYIKQIITSVRFIFKFLSLPQTRPYLNSSASINHDGTKSWGKNLKETTHLVYDGRGCKRINDTNYAIPWPIFAPSSHFSWTKR